MIKYILIFLCASFISSLSQILLKKSASREHKNFILEYINFNVIVSYLIFFGCTFITIYAYRGMDFSLGPVLETSSYIFITFLSAVILKEKITKKKLIGILIIIMGILLYVI